MITSKMLDGLEVFEKEITGRRKLMVYPLTFGRARLGISSALAYQQGSFDDVW